MSKPVASHFNLPNHSYRNMTIINLQPIFTTREHKTLKQKLIFQLEIHVTIFPPMAKLPHTPGPHPHKIQQQHTIKIIIIIGFDEGLTHKTSAFQIFYRGDSSFINSFDKTKFSRFKLEFSLIIISEIMNSLKWDRTSPMPWAPWGSSEFPFIWVPQKENITFYCFFLTRNLLYLPVYDLSAFSMYLYSNYSGHK